MPAVRVRRRIRKPLIRVRSRRGGPLVQRHDRGHLCWVSRGPRLERSPVRFAQDETSNRFPVGEVAELVVLHVRRERGVHRPAVTDDARAGGDGPGGVHTNTEELATYAAPAPTITILQSPS